MHPFNLLIFDGDLSPEEVYLSLSLFPDDNRLCFIFCVQVIQRVLQVLYLRVGGTARPSTTLF